MLSGIVASVYAVGQTPPAAPLATAGFDPTSSSNCGSNASGDWTCAFSFQAPVGTYDVTFIGYDALPQSNGALPSGAHALGSVSFTVPLLAGKTNSLNAVLQPIVSGIVLSNSYSFVAGSAGSLPLSVQAFDRDDHAIVAGTQTVTNGSETETDTFANPITLSVADAGGFTKLSKNGGAPASAITLNASSDTVMLEYSAGTPVGYFATITANAAGVPSSETSLAAFSATLSAQTLTADGPAATITATEKQPLEGDGAVYLFFTITQTNAGTTACPNDALAFYELYFYGPTDTIAAYAPGNCTIQVSDGNITIPLNVKIAPGTPQPPGHIVEAVYNRGITGLPLNSQIVRYSTSNPGNSSSFSTPSNDLVEGIAADPSGDVYVSTTRSTGNFALEKYAAGVTGAATPETSIVLSDPVGVGQVAVDGAGNVYVTLIGNGEVAEYTPSLSMQVATLSGPNTGLFPGDANGDYGITGGIAADAAGNLYVGTGPATAPSYSITSAGFGISVFAPLGPGTYDVAPARTLSAGTGSDIAVDSGGNIFADSPGNSRVTEFPAGINAAPVPFYGPDIAYGFTVEHGQLYVSTAPSGPSSAVVPATAGWFIFQVSNPSAGGVPFMDNVFAPRFMTAY